MRWLRGCLSYMFVRFSCYQYTEDLLTELAKQSCYSEQTIKSLSFIEEGVVDAELVTAVLWLIIDTKPLGGVRL